MGTESFVKRRHKSKIALFSPFVNQYRRAEPGEHPTLPSNLNLFVALEDGQILRCDKPDEKRFVEMEWYSNGKTCLSLINSLI